MSFLLTCSNRTIVELKVADKTKSALYRRFQSHLRGVKEKTEDRKRKAIGNYVLFQNHTNAPLQHAITPGLSHAAIDLDMKGKSALAAKVDEDDNKKT